MENSSPKRSEFLEAGQQLPCSGGRRAGALTRDQPGSVYYLPPPVSAADLVLMRRIDELHLECTFAGIRMLRDILAGAGIFVGRLYVATLMKRMAIEAIYRRPNT